MSKEHFEAAMLAVDRRDEGTTNQIAFAIAVMFTPKEHRTPCKLVKLVH